MTLIVYSYYLREQQGRRQGIEIRGAPTWLGGPIMASAGARAYMGSGGIAPSGVQGQSPWSGGQGGEAPLKLTTFQQLRHDVCIDNLFVITTFSCVTQKHKNHEISKMFITVTTFNVKFGLVLLKLVL